MAENKWVTGVITPVSGVITWLERVGAHLAGTVNISSIGSLVQKLRCANLERTVITETVKQRKEPQKTLQIKKGTRPTVK